MRVEAITTLGADGTAVTLYEKRLLPRELGEPEAHAQLRVEADLLAALGGQATPRLVDSGEDERGPWLRTEKIGFPTLAQRIEQAGDGPLEGAWIERAIRAGFAALAVLHEAADASGPLHIVHADVSPANLLVDDPGTRAFLIDLGLASWRGGALRDGAFRGTVAYVAPEVARGEVPTAASDLFALAATFLHAAIGAPPRTGPSLAAMLAAAAERPLLDELEVTRIDLAACGPGHAALVRCLAHLPSERPASANDVLALLK